MDHHSDDDIRQEFTPSTHQKPLLKSSARSSALGGLATPLAIIVVGGLLVLGITKMLSSGRTHRDLVRELQSKTFGNRWVAAFELSKVVAGGGLEPGEVPWLANQLATLYRNAPDHRTRNFIVIALGALKHPQVLPLLEEAIDDPHKDVAFNAVVALGNLPPGMNIHWPKLMDKTHSPDDGIRHSAILALATHKAPGAKSFIEPRLQDDSIAVRYASALALIQYRSPLAVATAREILARDTHPQFDAIGLQKIRLNLISAIGKEGWQIFTPDLKRVVQQTQDLRVKTTAEEALNLLLKI